VAEYLELVLPISGKDGRATPYFEDYLYSIIRSLGGEGADPIENTIYNTEASASQTWTSGYLNRLARRVEALEGDLTMYKTAHSVSQLQLDTAGYTALSKSSAHTARHNEWIEASRGAPITLPDNPLLNDRVRISIGDNSGITVMSSSMNIKVRGDLCFAFSSCIAGESFDAHFFGEYWLIT
jgi:hypothetical protein